MDNYISDGVYRVIDVDANKIIFINSMKEKLEINVNEKDLDVDDVIYFECKVKSILHKSGDLHTTLYLTNKCNSNCVMCPDSEALRKMKNNVPISNIYEFIDVLPNYIKTFDITGGEPTLLKEDLICIINKVFNKYPESETLLISNGRAFADCEYALKMQKISDKLFKVEIPIHSSYAELHNYIAGSKDSFEQTIMGIDNLCKIGVKVGIRIVISRLNINNLKNIVDLIAVKFPMVTYINFMGMEVLGNAYINRSQVWIEFIEVKSKIEEAVEYCMFRGINPNLYNFPLCMFDKKFWSFYKQSITLSKIKYKEDCELCRIKKYCGGFFNSTIVHSSFSVKPLKDENLQYYDK